MTAFSLPALRMLALVAALGLSGCQSSEEKAARHFESAQALLAEGDEDRAIVEFRNVFKYAPNHLEARQAFADLLLARGDLVEGYGQLLLLVEQYPDLVDARVTLAEIALSQNEWDELERHARAAERLDSGRPDVQALVLALDFRAATTADNTASRNRLAAKAQQMRATLPDNPTLRRILIDHLNASADPQSALPLIDEALAELPMDYSLQQLKLSLAARADDTAGVGAQLRLMNDLFPQAEEVSLALLQWYLTQNDLDGAEAFLRQKAGPIDGPVEGHIALIEFLKTVRSPDAALAELDSLITALDGRPEADLYTAIRASHRFEQGDAPTAIAEIDGLLAKAQPSDQTRRIKALQAQMLLRQGDRPRAEALVAEVLAEDPTHVEALLMRAGWSIDADQASQAIIDLRAAQSQSPDDPRLQALMATAYLRDGSTELAGESLALAVKSSASAPDYALRYAAFLQDQGRIELAKAVLVDSWRANPVNPPLLERLAGIALATEDWPLAGQLSAAMRGLGDEAYAAAADQLDSAILIGQDRIDEGLAILESRAGAGSTDARWIGLVVQTQIRSGKTDDARRFLDDALVRLPDDRGLRHQSAALDALLNNTDAAIAGYRRLLKDNPADDLATRQLYALLLTAGEQTEAEALLETSLQANPTSADLRWIKASALEQKGEIDAAIAIYDALYAEDSSNVIVANNLASLLSIHRSDAASLDRAYAIARRLRSSNVPAFQDTFGWITHLRGDTVEALPYLEAAAEGLPQDPSVNYRLGTIYADLGRVDEGKDRLTRAIDLAGDTPLAFVPLARQRLADLAKPAAPQP